MKVREVDDGVWEVGQGGGMQDAERERQDGEGSSLTAGSLLMDGDESGNEEEKAAFCGGKGEDAGHDWNSRLYVGVLNQRV